MVGWQQHEADGDVVAPENGERRFNRMPKYIFIKFEGATWQIADLEPGVYPLKPNNKTWSIDSDPKKKIRARRTGFTIVPDFANTDHSVQDHREIKQNCIC